MDNKAFLQSLVFPVACVKNEKNEDCQYCLFNGCEDCPYNDLD